MYMRVFIHTLFCESPALANLWKNEERRKVALKISLDDTSPYKIIHTYSTFNKVDKIKNDEALHCSLFFNYFE